MTRFLLLAKQIRKTAKTFICYSEKNLSTIFIVNYLFIRGDHKEPEKRKPIPTKIIAGMLETAGTSQVQLNIKK